MTQFIKFINGPVNYIQLTGIIGGIQKNITIFLDKHMDINNQTRCDSFDSMDISQYLYNMIKNANIPLDFFLEIREQQIQLPQTDKKDIYIKDVIEMFKTEFIIEKDKVKYSKSNPNVRLQYLDIRDHIGLIQINIMIQNDIIPIVKLLQNNTDNNKLKLTKIIINHIKSLHYHIKLILKNKHNIQKNQSYNQSYSFDMKTQEYYLNKIINKYDNETLKNNINTFFNMNTKKYTNEIREILSYIIDNLSSYEMNLHNNFYLDEIVKFLNELNIIILKLYTLFTDIYFLRRFLDKDYIKNVVSYCGNYHGLNYLYFLVKYCDFKIIKIYNSNNMSIDDIIENFKNINYVQQVYTLFSLEKQKVKQCVNNISISDFIVN